jgi:hypothetical protein
MYKFLIQSILTYAVFVYDSTRASNNLRHQLFQNKSLVVTDNYTRDFLIPKLHGALNIEPIQDIIHLLTATFLANTPPHPKALVQYIGN